MIMDCLSAIGMLGMDCKVFKIKAKRQQEYRKDDYSVALILMLHEDQYHGNRQ